MNHEKQIVLSRRDFLRLGLLGGGAVVLDSCFSPPSEVVQSGIPAPETTVELTPTISLELPLTPDMKKEASAAFDGAYEEIKRRYLRDAGNGALRVVHDPSANDTALEGQAQGELFALYQGDMETLERLFAYDDRYQKENGLKPWWIYANGEVADQTAVSAVMMNLAAVRVLSSSRQDEGKEMLLNIRKHLIDQTTWLPKAFDTVGSAYLTNPAYWNPLFLELFSTVDPDWNNVIQACRTYEDEMKKKIEAGELAYPPNWTDFQANPTNGPSGEPIITYDASYLPLNHAQAALYCTDGEARRHSAEQLRMYNEFFYNIIAKKDQNGNVTYNSDNLKDNYNLDGTIRPKQNGELYSDTAFFSAAAVASLASSDKAYRDMMFEKLINLQTKNYPFNDYQRASSLLTLSGKMRTKR